MIFVEYKINFATLLAICLSLLSANVNVTDQPGAIEWLRPAVQQLGGLVPDHLPGLQHHVVQLQPITDEC